tara:strand:+ start:29646 stop:30212 length:567 start_codon:yes stop_codon:yes gene_type:complete
LDFLDIGLISLGLAMDCFAVAFAASLGKRVSSAAEAIRMAILFGFFQGFMPFLGWSGGRAFTDLIAPFDHWVAFGLLAIIALHLFYEAWQDDGAEDITRVMTWKGLLTLSVATSIDAMAAGLSFSVMSVSILVPVLCIGLVAAIMTLLGVILGRYSRGPLDRYAAALGGVILLGIGSRILVEHISRGI